jgi:peptidyl-prolyl cis-trans isomerase C
LRAIPPLQRDDGWATSAAITSAPRISLLQSKERAMPTKPLTRLSLVVAATLLAFGTGGVRAQDKDPVLAKVNGVEIRQSDLAIAEEEAGQLPPMTDVQKRDYLVQFMADLIVVSKEAEKKKLADTPEFKRRVAFVRSKLLMQTLLFNAGKDALTDAAMRKVYDEAIKEMGQEQEVRARHILVRAAAGDEKAGKDAEDKIKAVIARLKKGEDFEKVASEATEDPSGKANGGDLGYFTKEQMVPEFADAAFALQKGQLSEPVKTQFGWHVIKLEDKRAKEPPKFDEVKGQIQQYVVRKAQADLVTGLRASAKIEKMYKTEEPTKPDAGKQDPAKKK